MANLSDIVAIAGATILLAAIVSAIFKMFHSPFPVITDTRRRVIAAGVGAVLLAVGLMIAPVAPALV